MISEKKKCYTCRNSGRKVVREQNKKKTHRSNANTFFAPLRLSAQLGRINIAAIETFRPAHFHLGTLNY